jgi:hypothetical protein
MKLCAILDFRQVPQRLGRKMVTNSEVLSASLPYILEHHSNPTATNDRGVIVDSANSDSYSRPPMDEEVRLMKNEF